MAYITTSVEVDVEVDLAEFEFHEIEEFIEENDPDNRLSKAKLAALYDLYRTDRDKFNKSMEELFYEALGRIA